MYTVVMALFGVDISGGLELAQRVHAKYRPVFDSASDADRAALAMYFLPHRSKKDVLAVTRPRVLKWYCPFADQQTFPSGHRYCINTYTGCAHDCSYCYATGYEPEQATCKKDFERGLLRDLADLDKYNVPPAPVHLSNSTDPFQPLELEVGQTRFALEAILKYRHRFTSVVLLTKNPSIPARPEYAALAQQLAPLRIEVSLAFWRDDARKFFEPESPPVQERTDAIRRLRAMEIPVVVRIDPLLPRSPLPGSKTLADVGLPDPQPLEDLDRLTAFAVEIGAMHVVYSVAKITRPRSRPMPKAMQALKRIYEHLAAPDKLIFRSGSWRLPRPIAQAHIVAPFITLCRRRNLTAKFCMQNLIETR